ncbi:MAG: DNA recombination protein RmuC, partial [Gammaproteobacteria bacterium]|nr:DNA recombination protein RmuC [Gammaproteobacteria bacterium]
TERMLEEHANGFEKISHLIEHYALQSGRDLSSNLLQMRNEYDRQLHHQREQFEQKIYQLSSQLSELQKWQQQVDQLTHKVHQLNRILDHSTLKGKFGEMQLENLLHDRYPSDWLIAQHMLPTGVRADYIFRPHHDQPFIAIDSKFPVQSFRLLLEHPEHPEYMKDFIQVMKKNIQDVSEKYILSGVTANYAILFVPSAALFLKLLDFPELLHHAHSYNVFICCPQTLYWVCDTMKRILLHERWTSEQKSHINTLKEYGQHVENIIAQFDQWEKRFQQLRQDGRALRKQCVLFEDFLADLNTLEEPSANLANETLNETV